MRYLRASSPAVGRIPFHPRVRVGLIVDGMLRAQWSLRALETLAATDVGAWWRCGGLRPDHRTLGDFLVTHATLLTRVWSRRRTSSPRLRSEPRCAAR
jgi:hypothetical protein